MSVPTSSAIVAWQGRNLDFSGTFGSGFDFEIGGGSHKKAGDPMEFLLAGVAGCTAIDVVSILQKQRQKVTGLAVEASGAFAQDHPMVYTDVTLTYIVRGEDNDPRAVEKTIKLSEEKYCCASAMFVRAGAKMTSSYRIEAG